MHSNSLMAKTRLTLTRWALILKIQRMVNSYEKSQQRAQDAILRIGGKQAVQRHILTFNARKLHFDALLARTVGAGRKLGDLSVDELKIVEYLATVEIARKLVPGCLSTR